MHMPFKTSPADKQGVKLLRLVPNQSTYQVPNQWTQIRCRDGCHKIAEADVVQMRPDRFPLVRSRQVICHALTKSGQTADYNSYEASFQLVPHA